MKIGRYGYLGLLVYLFVFCLLVFWELYLSASVLLIFVVTSSLWFFVPILVWREQRAKRRLYREIGRYKRECSSKERKEIRDMAMQRVGHWYHWSFITMLVFPLSFVPARLFFEDMVDYINEVAGTFDATFLMSVTLVPIVVVSLLIMSKSYKAF